MTKNYSMYYLLCASVFQNLAESNWRRAAYKKPPEIRYLLNHFPLMLWWIVTTSAHLKRFWRLHILFCLFTIYIILHSSVYILAAGKKSYASYHWYCIEYQFWEMEEIISKYRIWSEKKPDFLETCESFCIFFPYLQTM